MRINTITQSFDSTPLLAIPFCRDHSKKYALLSGSFSSNSSRFGEDREGRLRKKLSKFAL